MLCVFAAEEFRRPRRIIDYDYDQGDWSLV